MIKATLQLYRDSLADAFRALTRGVWSMAFLLFAFIGITVASIALSPFGIAGGFVVGFIVAGLAGAYLALVEIGVAGRRRVGLSDLRDVIGTYFWEVISVMFLFWIPLLVLQLTVSPAVVLVITAGAALVFNPAPEIVYQDRITSVECLQRSMSFMQRNWPEWMAPHLVVWGILVAWGYWATGVWRPEWIVDLLQIFGPFFGFITAGSTALSVMGTGLSGFVSYFAMFAFVHFVMLFRGQLYKRLSSGSRRARAWRQRLG